MVGLRDECKYYKFIMEEKPMSEIIFSDCVFRYIDDNEELYCKNKKRMDMTDISCDNCQMNVHLNCDNYSPKKDYCLKFFRDNISELKECQEKTVFNDKNLSKKWSN